MTSHSKAFVASEDLTYHRVHSEEPCFLGPQRLHVPTIDISTAEMNGATNHRCDAAHLNDIYLVFSLLLFAHDFLDPRETRVSCIKVHGNENCNECRICDYKCDGQAKQRESTVKGGEDNDLESAFGKFYN
jgi:hypothetical protein